jgi:hypothetical protein
MQKPLTRRHALPLLCAAIAAAPSVSAQAGAAGPVKGEPLPRGYGRCSLCACPAYTGSQWVCDNCGHNYQMHW